MHILPRNGVAVGHDGHVGIFPRQCASHRRHLLQQGGSVARPGTGALPTRPVASVNGNARDARPTQAAAKIHRRLFGIQQANFDRHGQFGTGGVDRRPDHLTNHIGFVHQITAKVSHVGRALRTAQIQIEGGHTTSGGAHGGGRKHAGIVARHVQNSGAIGLCENSDEAD